MGRPRKYIQDASGQQVDGLSVHKPSGQYYSIDHETGKRRYWGPDRGRAIREYRREIDPPALQSLSDDVAVGELLSQGIDPETIDDNPGLIRLVKRGRMEVNGDFLKLKPNAPLSKFVRWLQNDGEFPEEFLPKDSPKRSAKRLRDCLTFWKDWKTDKGLKSETINDRAKYFERFIECVGNLRVSEMTQDDINKFQKWVNRQGQGKVGKWTNDHFDIAKEILSLAKRKNHNWYFTDGLIEWVSDFDRKRYKAAKHNRQAMPVDIFQSILSVADEWSKDGYEQYDKVTQSDKGKRRHAKMRDGIQLNAICHLVVNCGLGNSECGVIRWDNLKDLDGEFPFMDFPRYKPEHQTGEPVERYTPLLPATVVALKAWRTYELRADGLIFRSDHKSPWKKSTIGNFVTRARDKTENDEAKRWTFKHIRNVGSTLRKRHHLPADMTTAFLGHTPKTTDAMYEGDMTARYMIPLVNLLVDERYIDGSKIA